METGRMEAFSDGVLAIIITITVLGMKMPEGTSTQDLLSLVPEILIYAMSFVYVGAYWNNHHHTLQVVKYVNGKILWANLFFLFWISMIPFMTNRMSANINEWIPTMAYGIILLMTAVGYSVLQQAIVRTGDDKCGILAKSLRDGRVKGFVTGVLYVVAIALTPWFVHVSQVLYVVLLALWLVPDRAISRRVDKRVQLQEISNEEVNTSTEARQPMEEDNNNTDISEDNNNGDN